MANSFSHVAVILTDRFKRPVGQISFWAYLFVAVVWVGGLGVWHAVYEVFSGAQPRAAISMATYTYFAALAGKNVCFGVRGALQYDS
jgi:hypothetical protein